MKVSIIIPVYNSEDYIHRCVHSICNQSYKNIEIILINDGSKDKSGIICDDFAKKDKRVNVVHQENKGVSSARNNGLKLATGEFICFVDSDDKVLEDYIKNLIEDYYKSDNTDLVFQGNTKIFGNDETKSTFFEDDVVSVFDKRRLFVDFEISRHGNPISKLFKTEIIRNNNLEFNENFTFNEDKIFVLEYLKTCKGDVVFSKTVNYQYHINPGSLSNGLLQPEEYLKPYKYFKNLVKKDFQINYEEEEYSIIYQNFKIYLHMYVNAIFVYKKGEERDCLDKMDEEDWKIYKHVSKTMSSLSRRIFDFFLLNKLIFILRIITPLVITPLFTLRTE